MQPATPTRRIRFASVTCASTTRGSSSAPAPTECGKSADQCLAGHAEHGVAPDEQIEVHGVEAVSRGIGEPADVPRCDRVAHPLDEAAPVGGCADMSQPPETRARQPAELRIAHAEKSRPRVVLLQALADLRK